MVARISKCFEPAEIRRSHRCKKPVAFHRYRLRNASQFALIPSKGDAAPRKLDRFRIRVFRGMSLPPTLDQAGWEIPASSAARLVGVAGPRMKLARRFAAEELCGRTSL